MIAPTLNLLFTWIGIISGLVTVYSVHFKKYSKVLTIASFFVVVSPIGTWYTGNIVEESKIEKITTLEGDLNNLKPNIISCESDNLNLPDNGIFRHDYLITVTSPQVYTSFYTKIQGKLKIIGQPTSIETNYMGTIPSKNNIPYRNYILTFWTDKEINLKEELVFVSLSQTSLKDDFKCLK